MSRVSNSERLNKRRSRIRYKLRKSILAGDSKCTYRLTIFKSNMYIYSQVIDDAKGVTLCSASSNEPDFKKSHKGLNVSVAAEIGKLLGSRALKAGINKVVFDRSGYLYHGRIKAFADGAREAGLEF